MVKLYVEGGGDTAVLKTACREGFTKFLTRAGLTKRPRIVACGGRQNAYESFRTAVESGEEALLLVDSEGPVAAQVQPDNPQTWQPWKHLKARPGDGWDRPPSAADTDCHLMIQCMESWFLADRAALAAFFGQGYRENALPAVANPIDGVGKEQVYSALANATKDCKTKAPYGKGEHSFKLLAALDPDKVRIASAWANRFFVELKTKMGA